MNFFSEYIHWIYIRMGPYTDLSLCIPTYNIYTPIFLFLGFNESVFPEEK